MGKFKIGGLRSGEASAEEWVAQFARACLLIAVVWGVGTTHATTTPSVTKPCRIEGLPNEVQCGSVRRPLDTARPDGPMIDVQYVVVPAMARNKQTDAVLLLAGGPGQSAIDVAPAVLPMFSRLNNRRDLVFIDQRGTGRSAPLLCADESHLPLQQVIDPEQQLVRLAQCRSGLAQLPYGDLRFFTTSLAMQDFEAVRVQLGVSRWNLVGASYGTRAALEYQRQFPGAVRRTLIDGVAPPDMVLPSSFSQDGQAALDAVWKACKADTQGERACAVQFPELRTQWAGLLHSLPRSVVIRHPFTGVDETVTMTRSTLLRLVRTSLYGPSQAAALPAAVVAAAVRGDFGGLVGLSGAMGRNKSQRLAMGMHFSVICAEDLPRMANAQQPLGADFGDSDAVLYASVCKEWPRGEVAPAFYSVPPAQTPVLVLSGGADPVTPARHGERVAKALGAKAQHIVVAQAGHGVMSIGCMRDVVYRFIAAKTDESALPQDASCATQLPRPGVFLPMQSASQPKVQP